MKQVLAERLLANVMSWDEDEISRELPKLLAIARAKYDQYFQYRPGMRFIESLAAWLAQFRTLEEKRTAYELVTSKLVYFSAEEMFHLIQMAFPDLVRPRMMQVISDECGIPGYAVSRIASSREYLALQARTLYLGLSDGAQIGLFRRLNPGVVGHEHTLITYEPPDEARASKMRDKHLKEALERVLGKDHQEELNFRHLVLVDDFTASGVSFLRKESVGKREEWTGKLGKVLDWIEKDRYHSLLSNGDLHVTVLFYIATDQALRSIRSQAEEFCRERDLNIGLKVEAVQVLSNDVRILAPNGTALGRLLRGYTNSKDLINEHWEKGAHSEPYLGYNECALPVVVFHNTPNNSLPLIWYWSRDDTIADARVALFPRQTRHGAQ